MPSTEQQINDRFLRQYTEHKPSLRGYVRSLVPPRDDAHEVMQDLAVTLWRKYAELATAAEFRPCAFGMARMEVLAWRRDRARDRHFFGEDAMAVITAQAAQMRDQLDAQREALEECLKKLPADQRTMVCDDYGPGVRIDQLAAQHARSRSPGVLRSSSSC